MRIIGEPDSSIDRTKIFGKKKPNYTVVYNKIGAKFAFYARTKGSNKKIKYGHLQMVELNQDSPIKINDFEFSKSDTTAFVQQFPNPEKRWTSGDGEITLTYQLELKNVSYLMQANFNESAKCTSITIDLLW